MSGEAAAGAGAGWQCDGKRFGEIVLNFLRPHVRDAGGAASMNTLGEMKFPMLLTSLIVMHPRRKVISAYVIQDFDALVYCDDK